MKLAKRLLSYSLPYKKWLLSALALILFTSAAINYLPVMIQRIIDTCLSGSTLDAPEKTQQLIHLGIIYVIIAFIGHLVRYFQAMLTAWIGQRIIYDLRLDVFRKVLRLQQSYFDNTAVGTLMTRVTSDIERLQHFVTEGVVGTVADLFMLIGIMGYMAYINLTLSLAIFALLPVIFAIMYFINHKLRNANRDIRDRQSNLNALLQEDLTGMTTIQLFNREEAAIAGFENQNDHLRSAYYSEVKWFSLYFPTIEIGQSISILLILAIGGLLILGDTVSITLGTLIAFLAYVRDFFRPLGSLSDKAGSFQVAMASIERIFALIDTPETINDSTKPANPNLLAGSVAFENVSFAYTENNPVIKNLSFSIEPGQVFAVVGATGAGKSTIINLLGRFYDVQEGRIAIGGTDIRDFETAELRGRLGYVFQDPFIFSASVAENISLNTPGITQDDIERAAKTVNAHDFICAMSDGYETVLNERGEGLSLGQKQLLAMARTLAQNPELLFVLDEATASVDTATEMLIQDALAKLMDNRTTIVIAHRLSTILHADQILVMRHGELIDQGTHAELINRGGYYQHLYELMLHSPEIK